MCAYLSSGYLHDEAVRLVQKHNFGCKGLAIAMTQNRENTLYNGVLYVRKSDLYTVFLRRNSNDGLSHSQFATLAPS